MSAIWREPASAYALLVVGLILVGESALPQYHFSPFWFSLGIISTIIALFDLLRRG